MLKRGGDNNGIKKQPSITFAEQGASVQVDRSDDQMVTKEKRNDNDRENTKSKLSLAIIS